MLHAEVQRCHRHAAQPANAGGGAGHKATRMESAQHRATMFKGALRRGQNEAASRDELQEAESTSAPARRRSEAIEATPW